MKLRSGQTLRAVLLFDAALMALIGFPLWGSYPRPLLALGIELPDGYGNLVPWHAVSMAGLFGGALLAFSATLVALALSRDHERLMMSTPLVILGTCVLGFVAFAKVTAFAFPALGYWMVVALMTPVGLLIIALLYESGRAQLASPDVLKLRDAGSQAERSRVARDLHDSVKQQLYSIHAHLAAADTRWETDGTGARMALAHARTGTRDAMREMAALLDRLHSDPVEAVGLVEALRRQCEALGFQTGADVTTDFGGLPDAARVDPATMNTLFRIGQEALANVARHARPSRVTVSAGITQDTGSREQFVLRVHDDGSGFEVSATDESSSMGLRSMRTRAGEIGATLTIDSTVGRGTSVEVGLPLPSAHGVSSATARRLLLGVGLPTVALLGWRLIWPEWSPFLQPFVIIGVVVAMAIGAWVVSARWMKQ